MREELEKAEGKLMAIVETINEYCGGSVLSDFLGYRNHPGVFCSRLNLSDSVMIHIAEIGIDLVILRLIEANHRMTDMLNDTNQKLRELQKELSKEVE